MRPGTKIVAGLVGLMLIGVVGAKVFQEPLSLRLLDRQLARTMDRDVVASLPEGLHVGLCGSAGPFPNRDRRGPCIFVIAGRDFYVVDAGAGSPGTIGSMRLPTGALKGIFLSHFHSDHIDGLGELMMNRWVQGAHKEPVPVYGPPGVERVVNGLREAYAQDSLYRTAHHGEGIAPPSGSGGRPVTYDLGSAPMASQVILEANGLKVTAFTVDHAPISPAVGYRFDYKGRSVVISGDTSPSPNVTAMSRGADVLVHEALQPAIIERFEAGARARGADGVAKIMHDILDYHTSPEEAAVIASEAGVDYLLLYHIVPPLPRFFDRAFLGDAGEHYDGPIKIGVDGFLLSLPAGSNAVKERNLL